MSDWSSIAFVHIVWCVLVVGRDLLQTLRFHFLFKSEVTVIAMAVKGNSQKDKKSRTGTALKIEQRITEKSEKGGKASAC
jgi:hypothetical protein